MAQRQQDARLALWHSKMSLGQKHYVVCPQCGCDLRAEYFRKHHLLVHGRNPSGLEIVRVVTQMTNQPRRYKGKNQSAQTMYIGAKQSAETEVEKPVAGNKRIRTAAEFILGRKWDSKEVPAYTEAIVANTWHGKRKKIRSTYSTPGYNADEQWANHIGVIS